MTKEDTFREIRQKMKSEQQNVWAHRHGFAQMALVQEALVRSRCGGDTALLVVLDVRFVAPLLLPGKMRVLVDDATSKVFATNEAGDITMIGSFELKEAPSARL